MHTRSTFRGNKLGEIESTFTRLENNDWKKHETRKLWKWRGKERSIPGLTLVRHEGWKRTHPRTALSQNGEYIFIRARGYRSNLNSSEFKGCNSNVRGRVHLQAARRLFKVSSEMVCVCVAAHSETNSAPFALAFGTAFNRDARPQIGGENEEIFRNDFQNGGHSRPP